MLRRLISRRIIIIIIISGMAKDTVIITMEGEYETVPNLANGATFNDLE